MSDTTFDLSAFEAAEVGVLDVQTTSGDPLMYDGNPVRLHLYGPGSEQFVRAAAKAETASKARTYAALRNGKAKGDDAAAERSDLIQKFAACTKTVENFPIPGGAKAIYENPRLGYITGQVQRFLDDWANFPPQSAQS